jgi:hypothetical protein
VTYDMEVHMNVHDPTPLASNPGQSRPVHRRILGVMLAGASLVAVGVGVNLSRSTVAAAQGNAVTDWNAVAGEAAKAGCLAPTTDPVHEARMYAITHIAIHDALNAIDRRYEPYAYDADAPDGTSSEAAVASAAHAALVATLAGLPSEMFGQACIDGGTAVVDAAYASALSGIPAGSAKTQGIELGEAAAAAIVALRADDRANDAPLVDVAYEEGTAPGEYRFTPTTPFAFAPKWGAVTPFVLRDSSQFASGPPYPLTSKRYADDYNEVKRLGARVGSDRSADQTEIATFWLESSPLSWNRIARGIAVDRGLDMWESARMFGLLNMGLTDGYIGTFQEKYVYNFWRPVTAIHEAATDGNAQTAPDANWQPLVDTPPIPDHDSGHAVEGAVAATVLKSVFGTDKVHFTACSLTMDAGQKCDDSTPVTREFNRLSDAAAENGESRILIGFHFRHAVVDGIAHGKHIANWTVSQAMQPSDG